ncbi:peptide deformylase [Arundinibacter roseus]|uniref:Peptide deformylase n=1 Tax=Arundinibacter roseus TaxID=2070510 RepID=A0A4R4KMF8_9BACT|nr:peptide deformylase [Arundinibacter roseus]TDB68182.1 peptide deformylase [Arundinibacter roseus]
MKGLADIILLGDERLYQTCESLSFQDDALIQEMVTDLHRALFQFREIYQAGRAIAAPQLGYMKRLIYMNIDGKATVFINPELVFLSDKMFELWDDCMSLPNLLVRVKRHQTIHIRYQDQDWNFHTDILEGDLSELLQHEYDHLNGVLCTMRAIDEKSFRWKPTANPPK